MRIYAENHNRACPEKALLALSALGTARAYVLVSLFVGLPKDTKTCKEAICEFEDEGLLSIYWMFTISHFPSLLSPTDHTDCTRIVYLRANRFLISN